MLSGEGGDELFGGYNFYAGHALAARAKPLVPLARPLVERLPTSTSKASTLDWQAKRFVSGAQLGPIERHAVWKSVFTPQERAGIVRDAWTTDADPVDLLRARYAETEGAEMLARIMDVDLGVFLVDDMLVKTDRATMANSLEGRVPLLDPAIVDFAMTVPTRHKVRGLAKKRLMRRAVEPILPEEILKGAKRGFVMPLAAWLRGPLRPLMLDTLGGETLERQGLFEAAPVRALIDDHLAGRADQSRKLWALLIASLWLDRYGPGAAA